MPVPKRPTKPPRDPQKPGLIGVLLKLAYIVAALGLIALLVERSQPQKNLVCDRNTNAPALFGFGTCREE